MIGVAADVYRGKFDTKFNRNDKNASQSRFNDQNNPAKGNYTQAGVKHEKTPPQQAQPKKTPTTVHDYYELTIDWARAHRAISLLSGHCSMKNSIKGSSKNSPYQKHKRFTTIWKAL